MPQFSLLEKVNLIVKNHVDKNKIVGWVVGIKKYKQDDIFMYGGYSDWENFIPMTPDKVFKIGSVTKLITSILVLQLVEQKKILLSESIRTYLPNLPAKFNTVKIKNLLNHTAGLMEYIDKNISQCFMYNDVSHSEIIDDISSKAIDSSGHFKYSNSHYFLLGKALESISGMEFKEYVDQQLGRLLGSHRFTRNWKKEGNIVPLGYIQHPDNIQTTQFPNQPLSLHNAGAAGGLCIHAKGLLSILNAFFNFKIVNKNLVQMAKKTLFEGDIPYMQYGLGLWRMNWKKATGFGHGGGTLRFTSAAFHIPKKKMEVVVLANTGWSPGILSLVEDIAAEV